MSHPTRVSDYEYICGSGPPCASSLPSFKLAANSTWDGHGPHPPTFSCWQTASQRVDRGGRPCICWWLGLLIGNCVHALGVADDLIWIEIHILWKTEGKTLAFQSKSHFKFVNLSSVRSIIQYGCHSGRSQTGIQDSITSSRTHGRGPLDSHCFSPEQE